MGGYDFFCNDLPPGPAFIPMRYYINAHKGGMPFLIFALMLYYDNFSLGCWLYLALHGSYGYCWLLKDFVFPDSNFERPVTFFCFFVAFFGVLQAYCYGAYLLASGQAPQNPSPERVCVCVMMYCFGLVLMMGADGQKYYTLRVKKGLMDDGYMKWSRNPNYVGEMMIYGSFALVVQMWDYWYVLWTMWTFMFLPRMINKDYSLSKKMGWNEYAATSFMLPFKFGGSFIISAIVYSVLGYAFFHCWTNGGIEKGAKLVFYKQS